MKIINLEQGTPGWLEYRKSHIMATDIAKIMGKSAWGNAPDVFDEKTEGKRKEETEAMRRGKELEIRAREMLINMRSVDLKPFVVESSDAPWMAASMDAINENGTIAYEIKCRGEKNMIKAMKGEYDSDYWWQCQWQMAVCGLFTMTLMFYHNNEIYHEITIPRDEKAIEEARRVGEDFFFLHLTPEKKPHKLFPTPFNYDGGANNIASRWKDLSLEIKELEEQKKALEEQIKELADNKPLYFPEANVCYSTYERKGVVDNERIYREFGIDKEKYRKETVKCGRLTIEE